jgi:hypothetical protein
MSKVISLILLCAAMALAQNQPQSLPNREEKTTKDEVTVTGCVSRLNASFVLMVTGQGLTYQLEETRKIKLDSYLGQEVEITGVKSTALPTSSQRRTASPVALTIHSIKTLQPRCSSD